MKKSLLAAAMTLVSVATFADTPLKDLKSLPAEIFLPEKVTFVEGEDDGDGAVDTVGGRHLQQLVDDGTQLLLGHRPLEQRHRLARDEGHHSGDGLSLEGLGDLRGRIHVDARQLETAGVLIGELLQDGGEVGTGLAARAVQDDDDRHLGGDLGDVTQAGGVDVDHERHR